jgi:TonB-linked SusC/RagA family outer membrane protein
MIMKKILIPCLFGALALTPVTVKAQTAGSVISGQVYSDLDGPVMMANVVEIDASNRIVAHGITDINGNFSFRITNPKNRLKVSYIGYQTRIIPIKGTTYKIKMEDANTMQTITVTAKKKVQGTGLAIPEHEISTASQRIDAKEFEGLGVTSVDEALQGRIAGLDIVANSGNLGSGTSMRLRGVSSINGNSEPLIVVDGNVQEVEEGFDYNNANEERFAQLLNVNPEDIESINVLKDAAATAIWGSQGANGVIEIKTKRGKRGPTRVDYTLNLQASTQPTGMKLLNGDEYTMLMKEAYFNPQLSTTASDMAEFNYNQNWSEYNMFAANTDWADAVKTTGFKQKHHISVSGGGEKANFRISGGYSHETGSIIEQALDQFTTRVALDYFVSDRIKVVTNFSLTYTDNKKNYSDLLSIAYKKMPNLAIYDENGDYYNMSIGRNNYTYTKSNDKLADQYGYENIVALAKLAKNEERNYNIVPEFQVLYRLLGIDDSSTRLDYEGKILFNITNNYTDSYYPSLLGSTWTSSSKSNVTSASSYKAMSWVTTHTLTFQPKFSNEDHFLLMMGRAQVSNGESNTSASSKWGLPSGSITSTGAEGIISGMSTSASHWRSVYFTYSAHYSYKEKYIADFSVRYDGSTRFGPSSRWGAFPALSFAWNAGDEKFIKEKLPFISLLRLRPGWGRVGNSPTSDYLYLSKYGAGASYNGSSIVPTNIRLTDLQWEEKETYNVGIDLGFLNDMITADFNVYTQTTSDLLMTNRSIPGSSGFGALAWQNAGKMRNNGWEFNVNATRVFKKKKFYMDFNVTFANNKNEILEMDETLLASLNGDFDKSNGSYLTRIQLNNAFGAMYGFRSKGVYQYSYDYYLNHADELGTNVSVPVVRDASGNIVYDENGRPKKMMFDYGDNGKNYEFKGGDAIYEDINHDGNINELDIVYLGSSLPKITGGFGFKIHFGKFTWNNQFNFRAGNKIINSARLTAESMSSNDNQSRAVNWRWRVDGDITTIPRAFNTSDEAVYNTLGSDRFIEDGSFLRLNYSQFNYELPERLVRSWGLRRIAAYLTINNLFCLTKYSGADPEVSYGSYGVVYDTAKTPRSRSFNFGLNISF